MALDFEVYFKFKLQHLLQVEALMNILRFEIQDAKTFIPENIQIIMKTKTVIYAIYEYST